MNQKYFEEERLIGNAFFRWYVFDAKNFRETQFHLGYQRIERQSDGIHTYLNKLCSQVKGRDIIFHLKKKKKKERKTDTAEEVLFAFNGPLSRIPFVAKHFEAKPSLKSDTNFEDKNRTL